MAWRQQIDGVTNVVTKQTALRLKKKRSYFNTMKKFLVLLTALAILATPAMAAGTHLEKKAVHHKQATKHQAKHQKKHANRKLARRNTRKHKIAV